MSNAKKTAEAAAEARAAAAQTPAKSVAYLGPDIKNVAVNGTVYTGGLPKALEDKITENPAIRGLVVPVSNLAAASAAIATKGTALNTLYTAVSAKMREQN